MTTLLTIPSTKALHLPTPTSQLLPLSSGGLTLTLLPADPPLRPSETLTLTIGSSSFPLSAKGRVQRVRAKEEHASYMFTPMPAGAEGDSVGQVVIQMKNSTNQTEWDNTEAMCKQFEDILKKYQLWDEKVHFVNDEYDTAGEPVKGWGETVAEAVTGGASFIAGKITSFAETHISNTPTSPSHPSSQTSNLASSLRSTSDSLASTANTGATWLGTQAHNIGVAINTHLPQSTRETINPPEEKKGDVRRGMEEEWEQVSIAAGGVAGGMGNVVGTAGQEGHRVIRNDYGIEADDVAKDIGATGTNIGSTALSATEATSAIVHAGHAANGAYQGKQ